MLHGMVFRSVVFLAVLALTAAGSEFTGKVVKVADGDTITAPAPVRPLAARHSWQRVLPLGARWEALPDEV